MATLKKSHKEFIIIELACFKTANEVKKDFMDHFGIEITTSQVSYYNPKGAQGSKELAQKWKDLFNNTRDKFLSEVSEIPIANRAYRLKKLQDSMISFERMGNYKGVNECLEQAAKEVGEAFTNKREHGLTSYLGSINLDELSDQQLERLANGEHPITVLKNEG